MKLTLRSWFTDFSDWVSIGHCSYVGPAAIPGQEVIVPQDQFYPCLQEWLQSDQGRNERDNIVLDAQEKIIGWKQFVMPIKIEDVYNEGPQYLIDMDKLAQ